MGCGLGDLECLLFWQQTVQQAHTVCDGLYGCCTGTMYSTDNFYLSGYIQQLEANYMVIEVKKLVVIVCMQFVIIQQNLVLCIMSIIIIIMMHMHILCI